MIAITKEYPERPLIKEEDLGIDFTSLMTDNDTSILRDVQSDDKPKRGRPKKQALADTGEMYRLTDAEPDQYSNSYNETNLMLRGTIGQIDMLNNDLTHELNSIKGSKTLKKKYEYISELAGTSSSLLSTKITAIREMNSSITTVHNLQLKRMKEMKLTEVDQNDDKRVMDMYNAFINTPVGNYTMGPSALELTAPTEGMIRVDMVNSGDPGFDNYMNNLSPEQKRMSMEGQNVKECVIFDPETGMRRFENINMDTGQTVGGLPTHAQNILDDCNINVNTGVARNSNLSINFPLVIRSSAPDTLNGF